MSRCSCWRSRWASAGWWCCAGWRLLGRFREKRRQTPPDQEGLSVSVLIPAYNEEPVIATSISRILASTHPKLDVIVIDDGSTDGTSEAVRGSFADEPRVKLITARNGGKARATNLGLQRATGDIVVVLDADTQFEPTTISRLVRWFADPKIGAVAGNAKVGNRINMLTRWQALEYITAQNLERRALATLGCITVVPGAVGAWRRESHHEAWRLPRGHACRGPGSHHPGPARGLQGGVRSVRRGLDGSAGHGRRASRNSASAGRSARCNACGSIGA